MINNKNNRKNLRKTYLIIGIIFIITGFFVQVVSYAQLCFIIGIIFIVGAEIIEGLRIIYINQYNQEKDVILSVSYYVEFEGHYRDENPELIKKHPISWSSTILFNINEIPEKFREPSNYLNYFEDFLRDYVKEHSLAENVNNNKFELDITSVSKIQ